MKEQYIRQVRRQLHLPRKVVAEVARDLNEIFASAAEHGETEQQVIERLGSPKDFAGQAAAQLGFDPSARRKRTGYLLSAALLAVGLAAWGLYAAARPDVPPAGAIGQADAMTNIQIEGAFGLNTVQLLPIFGLLALAIAIILAVRTARMDRRTP